MRLFIMAITVLVLGIPGAFSSETNLNCDMAPNAYCGWRGEYSLPVNAKNYQYSASCYNFQVKAASIECESIDNEKLCTTDANVCTCNNPDPVSMQLDIIVHCPPPKD
ncbi:MAG: hypothetical protein AAGI44_06070 [Pseudomonadota bacterium]